MRQNNYKKIIAFIKFDIVLLKVNFYFYSDVGDDFND